MRLYEICLAGGMTPAFLFFTAMAAGPFFAGEVSANALQLAQPVEIDESEYGSGPLLEPGRTYHVSVKGSDGADGLTWETSWRNLKHAVSRLGPGDTLLIGEGEYAEPKMVIGCSGEKGRPVTISAAPGHRVLVTGFARPGPVKRTPGTLFTCEVEHKLPARTPPENAGVWEEPAFIKLENAGTLKRVDELPGTFYYDEKKGRIYVRFSDSRGPEANRIAFSTQPVVGRRDIYGQPGRAGVELVGSYVHLRGIHFRGGFAALAVFEGDNNTIEDCSFFATDYGGLILWRRSNRNLVKNNYGVRNGLRGNIIMDKTGRPKNVDSDTLIIGNHLDSSAPTQRTAGVPVYFSIRSYGWPGHRNHVVSNILNEPGGGSFRWRGASPGSMFQGNVLTGYFNALNWYGKFAEDGSERIVVRNNTILGGASTKVFSMDPSGPSGNWAAEDIAFFNNMVFNNDLEKIEEACFADPEYLDYRLQSDSPFAGQAPGGGNAGAYYRQKGRILYVSPGGSDSAAGTSERLAFRTLARAVEELRAGDTLYISEGRYAEPLVVNSSGNPENNIKLRAYGRREVVLPGIILNGSYVSAEGLTVTGAPGDGIAVKGDGAALKRCLLAGNGGAGINAGGARNLSIRNCTLVNNRIGIHLHGGSAGASVRDNIFAGNAVYSVMIDEGSRPGYMSSHNAYHVSEKNPPAGEWGSVTGDLGFMDEEKGDYRVMQGSPAACLGIYSEAAGAFPAVARLPGIEGVEITNVRDTGVSVTWNTPLDDTTGRVYYRPKGSQPWEVVETRGFLQGTVHSAGLSGLEAGKEYEMKVEALGRRGGKAESPVFLFKTAGSPPEPGVFYVRPGGDDSSDGRAPEAAWKSIRKANVEAGPGDTILVAPGEYEHPVAPLAGGTEERRITYRRYGEGKVAVNGHRVMGPLLMLDSTGYVTVDGFTFTNAVDSIANVAVIRNSSDIEILNCRIGGKESLRDLFTKGVTVYASPNLRFEGNVVWGTRYHLVASTSPGLLVKNNTFVHGSVYSVLINNEMEARFINNIFSAPTSVARNPGLMFRTGNAAVESDYNLFHLPLRGKTIIGKIAEINIYNQAETTWEADVSGSTLEEWRKNSGQDSNSMAADPLFIDPENGDFRPGPGSPALGKGSGGSNIGAL